MFSRRRPSLATGDTTATSTPAATPGSAIAGLVRDVRRKSLRRRKLWMNTNTNTSFGPDTGDHNKNFGNFGSFGPLTPGPGLRPCSTPSGHSEGLHLSSYKKLKSPNFLSLDDSSGSFTSLSDKENVDPKRQEKKARRSSLFTPTSIRLR